MAVVVALIIIAVYLLPMWVAFARNPPSTGSVVVVNVFLGWTVIGWVVALAMACRDNRAWEYER